jgi:hypothetical protein
MPLDQFFKAQRHFVAQLSEWYNHEAVVLRNLGDLIGRYDVKC